MKYICSICGYVYDEEAEGVPFDSLPDDWTCPGCGAEKAMFDPQEESGTGLAGSFERHVSGVATMTKLSPAILSIVFSNLARGSGKQYQGEEERLYGEISSYFSSICDGEEADLGMLQTLVAEDLAQRFPAALESAQERGDRGALRARLWAEKVSRIVSSLLSRYGREGEAMLEGRQVWVCSVCGFIHIGDDAPGMCPVCKVPGWKFDSVS